MEATPGNFVYDWTYGDGAHEKGNYNAYHTFLNTSVNDTSYQIRMISTSFFGCLDTAYAKVVVYPSPDAQFNVTPEVQMYPDATVTVENQTNPGNFKFEWSFGDGQTSQTKDPTPKTYATYGSYVVRLKVSSEHCSDSLERRIKINPHPPLADFDPVDPSCAPLTVHFQNRSQYAESYLWEFGDGSVSNKPDPSYTYFETGEYTVKLTATGAGGSDSKTQTIKIFVVPKAFFDIFPKVSFVNEGSVNYTNMSENADSYEWEFGDGLKSEDLNPTHTYTSEGSYNVTLTVSTKNGCADKYTKDNAVVVEASGKIVFPNVFSPFSQLMDNKIFLPGIIDNVSDYHLMIYSRWGELVFESTNVDIGWDGYYNGKPAKQDVYMWKVVGKYSNGKNFMKTGDVTLLY
jgi:gliding motility-associated-like protein